MKDLKHRVAEFPVNRWLRSAAVNFHGLLMKNGLCPMGAWEKLRKMGEHEAHTDAGAGKAVSAGGDERRAA